MQQLGEQAGDEGQAQEGQSEGGSRTVEFYASLPDPHQSAVRFGGDGVVRVLLVAPESERIKMLPLVLLTSRLLRVRIDYVPDAGENVQEPDGDEVESPEETAEAVGDGNWNTQVLGQLSQVPKKTGKTPRRRG